MQNESKSARKENLIIAGPAGPLEALLEVPEDDAAGIAVVCHPHPLYGGTMLNKVAHTLARSFVSSGFQCLRFNFRGVGKSAGEFDEGNGETEDALAAVDWIRLRSPDLPLWLAGFSFGAAVAVRGSLQANPAGLVSIAPAVTRFAGNLEAQPQCPWLVVQGDQDELVDIDETVRWVDALEPGPELLVMEGAEHFFHGRLVELRGVVERFIEQHRDA